MGKSKRKEVGIRTERAHHETLADPPVQLWCRMGDGGEYESIGAADEDALRMVVEHWRECGVESGKLTFRSDGMGVEVGGYSGQNYISLYWGDAEAQPVRGLTDEEREDVEGYWRLSFAEISNSGAIPDLYVIALDETRNYTDAAAHLVEAGGRLYSVYIFDASRHVHACELTPSYELEYLYWSAEKSPEDEAAREKFAEEMDEANTGNELTAYVHTFDLSTPNLRRGKWERIGPSVLEWAELVEEHEGDREAAHKELMERYGENERCNPTYG